MRKLYSFSFFQTKLLILFLLFSAVNFAQDMQVNFNGGGIISDGDTVTLSAGDYMWFELTSNRGNCGNLRIEDITLSNNTDFAVGTYYNSWYRPLPVNIKASHCRNGIKIVYFYVLNITGNCSASTTVTIENNRDSPDFEFDFTMGTSAEIFVNAASFPNGDIYHGDTNTSSDNNTYFGVVEAAASVTRSYIVSNIGSCTLAVTALASSNPDFTVSSPYPIPITRELGEYTLIQVTFNAPDPAVAGTHSSVISITNTDNGTFTFTVSAEMFDEAIPGPGGITAGFKLWLKSTRGVVQSSSKVSLWQDLGTNDNDAEQPVSANQPTYLDTATDNINYNPVIKFENDGGGTEQYLYNTSLLSGFYNHDIFLVVIPDATMTSASSRNTIFSGKDSGNAGDLTGIGFGDYSSEFTNETLSYGQDVPGAGSFFNGDAEISSSYSGAGIINVRNDVDSSPTKQDILYNSNVLTTSNVSEVAFSNISGSHYWVGKNFDVAGSLNGRVAEIFTFSERLDDVDRQKVESYLAIKYGITLGASTEAQKNYVNSFDDDVWDITANSGYNYHVAGIGRDSISDLNQKQSKTLNLTNEISIGLGGVFPTNNANTNEFTKDGDFLVWGNNDGAFSGTSTETVTIAPGITTSLTHIDRTWKIVETNNHVDGDVGVVYVKIPSAAFSGFSKVSTEEYALIVADNPAFTSTDIIDVIPLRSLDAGVTLEAWYHFDGTKYFTYGKVANLLEDHSITLDGTNYLVGEYSLNLNSDAISISTWIKCDALGGDRTIMAKGDKLQIRVNPIGQLEMYIDDPVTPVFTSDMVVDDGKWHHTTYIYDSGSVLFYIDGVLDKSVPGIVHPSPNFNHFALGALYENGSASNYFNGEMDEVYVWDVGLTQNQVRYLMNQEVEKNGSNFVEGKILPYDATSNAMIAMPWTNLRAYYNFNSFYGSTTEGQTDDRFFLRLNYLNKDKELVEDQTAPLPYISAADGDWDTPATWSNNADQVIPNSMGLDGTTVIDWNIVEISHDIDSGDRDISLLGLIQTDGKLTIADPTVTSPVENNAGQSLTISHYLELDGIIDLVGESQLIQTDGSIIDADSGGFLERDQQGTANGFNYNYWSSSVGPIVGNSATRGTGISTTNANHTISGVLNDGTDTDAYQALDFIVALNTGVGPPPPPGTAKEISSYWFYKFYGPEDDYDSWESITESSSLNAGDGFTMKGTSGAVAITDQQNYVFKGLPNNGDITLPLNKNVTVQNPSGDVDRLIGNPYPSAIDATEFILDNMSIADGGNNASGTIFNGALYFWDHFGLVNSHQLASYVGGYATRNLTGGAVAISNDIRINNNLTTGSKIPGEYIPVNQGFFVSTALDGFDDENGAPVDVVDGGDIIFKNSQRVFATEDGSTSLFIKPSGKKEAITNNKPIDDSPTIRLMFDSPTGYHRQLVLGKNSNATSNFDLGYDAFMVDVSEEDMYWFFNEAKFVIQGVNNFDETQEFPLGLIIKTSGIARIKLDAVENLNDGKAIYIKDNVTNETALINNNPFEIFLEQGVYNNRFSLVFQSQSLSTDEVEVNDNVSIYFDKSISELKVRGLNDSQLLSITLFNIIGQEIKFIDYTSNKTSKHIAVKTGAYIVQLNTDKGNINKKIIIE